VGLINVVLVCKLSILAQTPNATTQFFYYKYLDLRLLYTDPSSYSRLDYKQHIQMNHVLNTDFYCKLTVLSSGVIYYFVYLQVNCIYTRNALLRLEALVAELGAIC
jgi:hypothetical protein